MIGFIFGCFLGAGLTLIVVGCFAVEDREAAYSAGYSNGFIAGADATAEKEIAKGVCA
jgi:hypothetical protein